MVSDQTLQQYIFLSALDQGEHPLSQHEIAERMGTLSQKMLDTLYYQRNPDSLPELIEPALRDALIERDGYDWRITAKGRKWRDFKYETYIRPAKIAHAA